MFYALREKLIRYNFVSLNERLFSPEPCCLQSVILKYQFRARTLFVLGFVYFVANKSVGHCRWGKQLHVTIPSTNIWKMHTVQLGIHDGYSNEEISPSLGVSLRTNSFWRKQPVHIIRFGVVTTDGDVMPSFIFPHGLRRNMPRRLGL